MRSRQSESNPQLGVGIFDLQDVFLSNSSPLLSRDSNYAGLSKNTITTTVLTLARQRSIFGTKDLEFSAPKSGFVFVPRPRSKHSSNYVDPYKKAAVDNGKDGLFY